MGRMVMATLFREVFGGSRTIRPILQAFAGQPVPAVNLWVKGEPAARLPFESVGSDLTPYPFLQI